ncbi:DUF6893 family small protein [Saccharopolyspora rhizosphaerae]
MRKLGIATTVFLLAAVAGGVYLGVLSWPDVKRYKRIRTM